MSAGVNAAFDEPSHWPRPRTRPCASASTGTIPVQGLIVTMEPLHTVNGPAQRAHLPRTAVPVSVCSADDLEHMVTIDDASIGQLLIERADDPKRSTYGLREALSGHSHAPNPVLEAGWTSYPWHPSASSRTP
jgi:hypothetical protein